MKRRRDPRGQKTYSALAPKATHFRPATCAEADCDLYRTGFRLRVDEATALGQQQAAYVRGDRTRGARETREAGLTVFTFEPGTACYRPHRVPLEREPLYLVRPGTVLAPAGPIRYHRRPELWAEDMQTTFDRVRARRG